MWVLGAVIYQTATRHKTLVGEMRLLKYATGLQDNLKFSLFGYDTSDKCDMWAVGCVIFEVIPGTRLSVDDFHILDWKRNDIMESDQLCGAIHEYVEASQKLGEQ